MKRNKIMTTTTHRHNPIYFFACSLFLLFLFSCSNEDDLSVKKDTSTITFTVQAPYYKPSTYAMDVAAENTITSIDVLAFKVDDTDGKEYFAYRSQATSISDKGSLDQKEFTVELRKSEEEHRFVIFANVKEELDKMSLSTTGVKEQMLSRLLSESPDKWNANSPSDFRAIPMWGESKEVMKITEDTKRITGISLLRSVAAIDVVVDAAAQAGFKLKEVYLYNYKSRGRVVPIGAVYDPVAKKVSVPSMPIDGDPIGNPLNILGPLEYTTTNQTSMLKQIYTYEAVGVNSGADMEATCLVVGGYYNGSSELTYYRLDFKVIDSGSFSKYMNLLRNHRYTVHITEVTDAGYDTPDEAFRRKKGYMQVNIQEWSMSDMQDEVIISDSYRFRIPTTLVELDYNVAYSELLTITTDYPGVITYTSSNPSWIIINGVSTDYKTVNISIPSNGSASQRTGTITIKAGNLSKDIVFKQTGTPN